MADDKRMVAVAIAVSGAESLPFLPGALNCAEAFFNWATAQGYEATLITDEHSDVTVDRLRTDLHTILADPRPIHRMVIYFAGHGLIRELESGLWLLSDWKKEGLVVAYESMRKRLSTFNITQIAIFSDACRSLPKSVFELQLEERGVLAPGVMQGEPDVDKFVAAQDGKQAFVVPGATVTDDVCVFSGVLLEALWGIREDAFSKLSPGSITSSSLGKYLKTEVPRVAKTYGLTLKPTVVPAFPEGDNIYLTVSTLPGTPPPFEWPKPPGPPQELTPPALSEPKFSDLAAGADLNVEFDSPGALPKRRNARADPAKTSGTRKPRTPSLLELLRSQSLPRSFDTGSGFAVEGAAIKRLWTPTRVVAEQRQSAGWWTVSESNNRLQGPAPVLIEFADGRFGALTALPDFVTGLVCDSRGVSAVAYRRSGSSAGAHATEDVIDKLERGALRADAVTDLAAKLRVEKHLDPMLGVFAAYLYDSIGDVGSIRRMAYFYVKNQQPIPYDIALLSQVRGQQRGDQLVVHIPSVPKQKPRSDAETTYPWTYEETPSHEGVVGGAWPWLRQGWAFLADPTDNESTLVRPGLPPLAKQLAPARFATFDTSGGLKLANLFGLVPSKPFIPFNPMPGSDYGVRIPPDSLSR